jgi:hypothetical protein
VHSKVIFAGTPMDVAPAGTSRNTALAPILSCRPTVTAPRILAPPPNIDMFFNFWNAAAARFTSNLLKTNIIIPYRGLWMDHDAIGMR